MAVLSTAPLQFIVSIPPVTRAFTALTVVSSLLYYALWWTGGDDFSAPYLVLVPGSSVFYPWTFVTSAFVETTIFEVSASDRVRIRILLTLMTASIVTACNTSVPPISGEAVGRHRNAKVHCGIGWCVEYHCVRPELAGVSGFAQPVILVRRCSSLYFWSSITLVCRYGMQYHGQMALQIAILVAFTQLIPEHQVQLFGFIKARVKVRLRMYVLYACTHCNLWDFQTLPMAYVTLSTVLCILGFQSPWIVIQFGWLVSYIWLRFYKKNSDAVGGGPAYGDRSETFAFVGWFPPFIQ